VRGRHGLVLDQFDDVYRARVILFSDSAPIGYARLLEMRACWARLLGIRACWECALIGDARLLGMRACSDARLLGMRAYWGCAYND